MSLRRFAPIWALALAVGGAGCAHTDGYYDTDEAAQTGYFYDELSPYGSWFELAPYGTVWSPYYDAGWRPYTFGRWVYTDWGWMWLSTDRFGGAPYHYGRWTYDGAYGWVWVPDQVWAPSWVSWRYGDGWVGWAPLPPDVRWQPGSGLEMSGVDLDSRIDSQLWTFVSEGDFTSATNLRHDILPVSRNVTLLPRTRNVTRYVSEGSRPVEQGLNPTMFRRINPGSIPRYRVVERTTPNGRRFTSIHGSEIEVYRPTPTSPPTAPPANTVRTREMLHQTTQRREEEERARMEKHIRRERDRLVREQRHEMRSIPPGLTAAELRARHDAELKEQQAAEQREREVFENRIQQLRKMARERDGERSQGKERGKDHEGGDPKTSP